MEQDIRFCELDGRRIAYATVGEGPLSSAAGGSPTWRRSGTTGLPGRSSRISRGHIASCATTASGRAVRAASAALRARRPRRASSRPSCGQAAEGPRPCSPAPAPARGRRVSRASRPRRCSGSCSSAATPRATTSRPQRATPRRLRAGQLAAGGADAGRPLRPAREWRGDRRRQRYQRRSADAEVASAFLDLDLRSDAGPYLPNVTAPALVLHRRGDRTVPIGRGRQLASLLPNARSSR